MFEQPEIEAARCIFQYVNGDLSRTLLRDLWLDADLGVSEEDVNRAINALPDLFDEDEKWLLKGLQEVYLNFLKTKQHPRPERGRNIYYNLGMFSEVIADLHPLRFGRASTGPSPTGWKTTPPTTTTKVDWRAVSTAPTPWTVHQSKGLHRLHPSPAAKPFPFVWHLIPETSVEDQSRYITNVEDERRLFYALTRAKKFLYCSFAPGEGRLSSSAKSTC